MPEVFQIKLGVTPMIAETPEQALVGVAKTLLTMNLGQKYPVVIDKIEVTQDWLDRVKAGTPWAKDAHEEKPQEEIARRLLASV